MSSLTSNISNPNKALWHPLYLNLEEIKAATLIIQTPSKKVAKKISQIIQRFNFKAIRDGTQVKVYLNTQLTNTESWTFNDFKKAYQQYPDDIPEAEDEKCLYLRYFTGLDASAFFIRLSFILACFLPTTTLVLPFVLMPNMVEKLHSTDAASAFLVLPGILTAFVCLLALCILIIQIFYKNKPSRKVSLVPYDDWYFLLNLNLFTTALNIVSFGLFFIIPKNINHSITNFVSPIQHVISDLAVFIGTHVVPIVLILLGIYCAYRFMRWLLFDGLS